MLARVGMLTVRWRFKHLNIYFLIIFYLLVWIAFISILENEITSKYFGDRVEDTSNFVRENFPNNLSNMTNSELARFYEFKETQYRKRRKRLKRFCDNQKHNFGQYMRAKSLLYSPLYNVGYCQIAKVASTTWCGHFVTLGKHNLVICHCAEHLKKSFCNLSVKLSIFFLKPFMILSQITFGFSLA